MPNIILAGFMGTGKTSTGKRLAERLGRNFLEMDDIIEKQEGASIRNIFETKGEAYFRKIEKKVAREVSAAKDAVISAGGGAIIDEENLKAFKASGVVICLEASADVILERTKSFTTRPLLNVKDPKKEIERLLEERRPYYKKADFCINTDGLTVEEVVEEILRLTGAA